MAERNIESILRRPSRVLGTVPGSIAGLLLSPAIVCADVAPPPSQPQPGGGASFIGPLTLFVFAIFAGLVLGAFVRALLVEARWFRRLKSHTARRALVVCISLSLFLLLGYLALAGLQRKNEQLRGFSREAREARINLGAIRSTEIAYFAEWGVFVGNAPLTPVADRSRRSERAAWLPGTRFSLLGFAPEGSVRCSYALEGVDWPSAAQGFAARAECDFGGFGDVDIFTVGAGSEEIRHATVRAPLSSYLLALLGR